MNASQRLLKAVDESDLDGVREALLSGASPDTTVERYTKPAVLTVAAERGAADIVRLLLEAGATPNPESGYEWTPLRAAATYGHAHVVRLLLDAGVDPNQSRGRGSIIAAALASRRHSPKPESVVTVRLLLAAGASVLPEEEPAVVLVAGSRAPASVLRLLLERGADPNATRSDGTPAIVVAAKRRNACLVDGLLAGGAEVDAVDSEGRTALMHAVERGSGDIVTSLLCAGVDKDEKASDGSSAHALALAWSRQNMRLMMGERSVGREVVDVPRSVIDQRADVIRLFGDRQKLEELAMLVDHAVDELGDVDFGTLVGSSAQEAHRVTERLRHVRQDYPHSSSLKQIDVTRDEHRAIRGALLNLAYGPPMAMPQGMTRAQLSDTFEDFTNINS
ncbi:MAG: hypothetical protein GEU97_09160 [Actinophytocola sp.]|nr:hypothetical protein [Actinophytocola sp.]